MPDFDPGGTAVAAGAVSAVPWALGAGLYLLLYVFLGWPGAVVSLGRGWIRLRRRGCAVWLCLQHLACFLGPRSEQDLAQTLNGGVFVFHQLGQVGEGLDRRFELFVALLTQHRPGALQMRFQILRVQFDSGRSHRTPASNWRKSGLSG